jgi:hypothetical protein
MSQFCRLRNPLRELSVVLDTIGRMSPRQQVRVPARYARVNAWVISRDTDAGVRFLLAGRFAGPAAQEAMAYVQRSLREELVSGADKRSPSG